MTFNWENAEIGQMTIFRFIEFAEILFNLQHFEGFEERVEYMKTADVESSYAEFNVAKFLHLHGIQFKFVVPKRIRGEDYDFEITYADGRVACAEAKCRALGADVRPDLLKNAFGEARRQLPSTRPGVVVVNLPQTWFDESVDLADEILRTTREFLAGTKRVVTVLFIGSLYFFRDGKIINPHRHAQIVNRNHRFNTSLPWALDTLHSTLPEWHHVFTTDLGDESQKP